MGAVVTGVTLGELSITLGQRLRFALEVLVAVLGLAMAYRILRLKPSRPPSSMWQVPREWEQFGPYWYAVLFGLALGTGFLTVIVASEFMLAAAVGLLSGPLGSVAVFLGFAAGRAVPYCMKLSGSNHSLPIYSATRPAVYAVRAVLVFALLGGIGRALIVPKFPPLP